jgi:hypothetical protein
MTYGLFALRTIRYGTHVFSPGEEVNPVIWNIPHSLWISWLNVRLLDYGKISNPDELKEESKSDEKPKAEPSKKPVEYPEIPPELAAIAGKGVEAKVVPEKSKKKASTPKSKKSSRSTRPKK